MQLRLDETVKTILKVFDITGNYIATLFDGTVEQNELYTLEFNAEDLSRGIYFYKLATENGLVRNGTLLLH